jgi:uncharacterized protein (TIGR04255 family)
VSTPQIPSPFGSEPIDEIHLSAAPLAKVVAQLRFPGLARLRDESVINSYASLLSDEYPLLQDRHGINFVITTEGVSQQQSTQRLWSMRSRDDDWRITISDNFLSLEALNYKGRDEFVSRFVEAAEMLMGLIDPPYAERFGIRYINRIDDQDLIKNRVSGMVRKEMLGGLGIARPEKVEIRHGVFDSLFVDGEHSIQVRCGLYPAKSIIDIDIPPAQDPVWILDIDSYTELKMTAVRQELAPRLRSLADRAYRMFRWVVNEEFIQHFGGS